MIGPRVAGGATGGAERGAKIWTGQQWNKSGHDGGG